MGDFVSYIEAGYRDMPMVVLMIDNMAAFREYFPEQAEQIGSLARESQGAGISIIITAATSSALNHRTQTYFGKKLVLHCNDSQEYSNVLGHCRKSRVRMPAAGCLWLTDGYWSSRRPYSERVGKRRREAGN